MVFVSHHVSQYHLYQAQFLFRNSFCVSLWFSISFPPGTKRSLLQRRRRKSHQRLQTTSKTLAVFLHYPISPIRVLLAFSFLISGSCQNSHVATATKPFPESPLWISTSSPTPRKDGRMFRWKLFRIYCSVEILGLFPGCCNQRPGACNSLRREANLLGR